MIASQQNGGAIIAFSFFVSYMLMAMPLPDWAANWRPTWVTMVLIYWCMALPKRVGIGVAWVLGVLLDVQQGTIFGQNALGMTIIAYIITMSYQRIRVFSLAQQAMLICIFLAFFHLITLCINGLLGFPVRHWTFWMPALTSMIIWPWLFILLRDIRRKFHVF